MQESIRDRFEIQYFKCQSNPVSLNTYLSNLRFTSRTLQINLYTSLSISCVLRQHYMNNSGFQLLHVHKLVSMDLKTSGIFKLIIRKRLFFLSAIAYKTTIRTIVNTPPSFFNELPYTGSWSIGKNRIQSCHVPGKHIPQLKITQPEIKNLWQSKHFFN